MLGGIVDPGDPWPNGFTCSRPGPVLSSTCGNGFDHARRGSWVGWGRLIAHELIRTQPTTCVGIWGIEVSDSTKAGAGQPRVLVAEDEALIRFDLVELLNDEGYEVVGQAGDGEAAVAMARELEPDLVVMDVKMPKMDGIAAAEVIAAERIAPVVMLTAFSQRELVEQAREAGAMAYVVKPFDASDVVPAIEIAMARYAEIRALDEEIEDLEERLSSRKIVDQAKGILQESLGLTEPEAFRWIQKTAMDLRKSMREVAEGVIDHAKAGRSKR